MLWAHAFTVGAPPTLGPPGPPQHGVEAGLRLCYGHPCATPELMQRRNINLTVPFADWRLGTTYRGPPPR